METVQAAARRAGVTFERLTVHGSRTHDHAYDVILSGSGTRSGWPGRDYQTATWDEWGIFLDVIFRRDPAASCRAYGSADHFRWATGGRFDALDLDGQHHRRHRWVYSGRACTGAYDVRRCTCGALQRWMVRGTFADISDAGHDGPVLQVTE